MSKYILVVMATFMFLAPAIRSQMMPEIRTVSQRATAEHEAVVSAVADELHLKMQQELISRAVVERQAKLKQDTDKLLALAAELKQHVDKTGPNVLSLDVIKKAQEIEKLAKSVREKMRDAF